MAMTENAGFSGSTDEVDFPKSELSLAAFHNPLEFIEREHSRYKEICRLILDEQVIDRLCYKKENALVIFLHDYFVTDLPNHILDEETNLFPLMRRRSSMEHDAGPLLDQVCKEHDFDKELTDFIIRDLGRMHRGRQLTNPLRLALNLQTFAEGLIRHTNWENLTILPMAKKILNADDMSTLGHAMAARRGFSDITAH